MVIVSREDNKKAKTSCIAVSPSSPYSLFIDVMTANCVKPHEVTIYKSETDAIAMGNRKRPVFFHCSMQLMRPQHGVEWIYTK